MAEAVTFEIRGEDKLSAILDKIAKRFRDMDNIFSDLAASGTSAFNKIQKGIRSFGNKAIEVAKKMQDGFKRAFKAVAGFAGSAVKAVTIGFTGIAVGIGFAVKEATKFDTAMREVLSLTDEGVGTLEKWKREIIALSTEMADAPVNVANSFFSLISASRQGAGQIDILKASSNLAVAGFTDMDSALKLVVTGLNSFNLGSNKAEHIADLLFTTIKEGQTRFELLSQFIPKVFAATADVGFKPGVGLAAFATLTSALGEKLNPEVATGVAALIKSIYARQITDKTPPWLANLITSVQTLPFDQAIEKIEGFLSTIQGAQRRFAAVQIIAGSEPAAQALGILTRNFDTFQEKLEAFSGTGGSSGAAAAVIMNSVGFQSKRLGTNFIALATSIGDVFLPALADVTRSFADLIGTLAKIDFVEFWRAFRGGEDIMPEVKALVDFVRDQWFDVFVSIQKDSDSFLRGLVDTVIDIANIIWQPLEVRFGVMFDRIIAKLETSFFEGLARISKSLEGTLAGRALGVTAETTAGFAGRAAQITQAERRLEQGRAGDIVAADAAAFKALQELPGKIGERFDASMDKLTDATNGLTQKMQDIQDARARAIGDTTAADIAALNELTGVGGGGPAPGPDIQGAEAMAQATRELAAGSITLSNQRIKFQGDTIVAIEILNETVENEQNSLTDMIKRLEETLAETQALNDVSKRRTNVPAPA